MTDTPKPTSGEASRWQVQMSRVADVWIPMGPRGTGPGATIHGMDSDVDHWFTDQAEAAKWADQLRNGLTWSVVRVIDNLGEARDVV